LAWLALVLAWLVPAQEPNWNQNAHYALVRALAEGRPDIDPGVAEQPINLAQGGTNDVAVFHGKLYAAKAPGLAAWTLPAFLGLRASGKGMPSDDLRQTLWLLTIWGAVLPAAVVTLLVQHLSDRLVPGYGSITAVTLGAATLVLPFASLFFAHMLTAALGFGAFALLAWKRHAPRRLSALLLAGVLAGLAVVVEFPSVVLVSALAAYVLARKPRREGMLAYSIGVVVGVLPLLVFNQWAFGSMTHLSYAGAIGGVNKEGLFGIGLPSFRVASELLFSTVGLLRVAPVLSLAAVGMALMYRRGERAEALFIAGLAFLYLSFNAAYETPFGGYSPGPRFLVPLIPFLVLPLAFAYRSFPATTIALAAASAIQVTAITMTGQLNAGDGDWFGRLWERDLGRTAFGFGATSGRAMPLVVLLLLGSGLFALLATRRPSLTATDVARAALAVAAWLMFAHWSPRLLENGTMKLFLLYAFLLASVLVVVAIAHILPSRLADDFRRRRESSDRFRTPN
jgi:hypothetical protein